MSSSAKSACLQRQTIGVEAESNLVTLNKKITEIKKRIQLSEGQRKAYYEENDNANKQNTEQLNNLKKDLKKLGDELVKAKTELGGEKHFRLVKYLHELGPAANRDHEQLKDLLDLKVIDLRKQLDLMKYTKKKKKAQLSKLEQEYQKLLSEKAKASGNKKKDKKVSKKAITKLENDIHRIDVQLMEAEHVRKKYSGIRHALLNDSVKFECALANVEKLIKQQNDEIKKLQEVNRSAMKMRDKTMSSLLQHESKAADASGLREKQLIFFKNKVDDRKAELERLERRIFPAARPTLVQQDSMGSGDIPAQDEDGGSNLEVNNMDEIFYKLMKATGVSDPECVFDKFQSQKATTERLFYLKNTMEEEKKHLEADQNVMLAEMEAYRFAQVKDKEENLEEMENLKMQISDEVEKEEVHRLEEKKMLEVLLDIKRSFYDCCLKLEDADDTKVPDWSNDISNLQEILNLLKTKYLAALEMVERPEVTTITEEFLTPKTDERRRSREVTPTPRVEEPPKLPLAYQDILAPRTKSRGAGTPSGVQAKATASDEEEEIPSRGFLKRQAQLIVDTKSRRKGYRMPPSKK